MSTNKNNIHLSPTDNTLISREVELRNQIEECAEIGGLEWNIETGDFWWSENINHILQIKDHPPLPSLQSLIGFIHPSDQQKVQTLFARVADEGGHFRLHTHALTRNGKEIPILLMVKSNTNSQKLIGYIQDISEDFTERASLLETLAKYRGVMSGAGDAIILLSHEGNIIEGNQKAAELLEVTEEELPNLTVDDIHLEEDLDIMMGHYQSFLWGQNEKAKSTIVGKQGGLATVEISGRPVDISSEQMLVVIFHDITLQQKAQNALKRSEQRYRSLVDEAREGILLLDSDGKIIATNPKLCESTGLKRSSLLESNFLEVTDFDMEVSPTELLKETGTRPSIHMEGNLKTKDGKLLPTGFNVARYQEQGEVQFIVTAYDLTSVRSGEEDRLELQKQLFQAQKQELLGQLAGSLAHDFNNLLSPILLVSEMLMEDAEDEFYEKNLSNINQAAQRARRLVRRILTYTRPEESEPTEIDIAHELKETLALLRSSIPQTIMIDDQSEEDEFKCFADLDQIHQIIMNIGTNAAQAIGEKHGTVTFELKKIHIDENSELISRFEIPEGDYATLCVTDTGPGIPDEIINQIFEPFFTTKTQTDGSGLGLSVVQRLVEIHGGAVEARHAENGGACVCVYLPLL
ncbi:putative Histidine kinase [Candidatus Terasakiella magnetica]|uniref:histidine kinase n=1 Tax=Candidatus Terasakiella magnetica TaxID=1867952 RepID=A0A1C3RC80_9PROT|nr:PAS domain-containing sensor histidine kinase [Candidatus Terasakiella magnetica]SCA54887.1 putative Histidine kinase [Candidatus Terasakiella magnetica]